MAEKSIEFGNRLKELILKRGLNVNQLSIKTGVGAPLIWNYIKLGRIPEAPHLYKLSKELMVSMEGLLNGEEAASFLNDPNKLLHFGRKYDQNPKHKKAFSLLEDILKLNNEQLIDHTITMMEQCLLLLTKPSKKIKIPGK
ncbi:MAG: helix-turn-helix transcriptional regulator [Thermodesulfobacteriota bacterium]